MGWMHRKKASGWGAAVTLKCIRVSSIAAQLAKVAPFAGGNEADV
jgi:hypothetical protein